MQAPTTKAQIDSMIRCIKGSMNESEEPISQKSASLYGKRVLQRLPHDFQRRVPACPERKGLRALMEKHSQTIAPLRAGRFDLLPEFHATDPVNGIEDKQIGG